MQLRRSGLGQLPAKQALAIALAELGRRKQAQIALEQAQQRARDADLPLVITPDAFAAHTTLLNDLESPFSALMSNEYQYKVLYGGRDSAKSWSVAEALVKIAAKRCVRILCTREYQNSVKDSVHALLRNTIWRLGLVNWFDITDKTIRSKCGSEFIFKGLHNNVQEIKSTEGVDICWVEEAHNTTDESWQVLIPTIRKAGSQIWITFNVTSEDAPTFVRWVLKPPPYTYVALVNYDQNPFLSEESKRAIAWLKESDYDAFEHVYLGRAKKISDAIIFGGRYDVCTWDEDLWKKAARLHFGLDHGFARDPYALTRSFILNEELYIEHEAFGVGVEFAGNVIEDVDEQGRPRVRGELEQLMDSVPDVHSGWPIKADNSRPETISFLAGKGYNVTAADKWTGCVEDGIAHIKGFRKIHIHERCKHMQQEARLYAYKRDAKTGEVLPIVLDKNNHGWDSVRYSLDGYIQRRGDVNTWTKLGKSYFGTHAAQLQG